MTAPTGLNTMGTFNGKLKFICPEDIATKPPKSPVTLQSSTSPNKVTRNGRAIKKIKLILSYLKWPCRKNVSIVGKRIRARRSRVLKLLKRFNPRRCNSYGMKTTSKSISKSKACSYVRTTTSTSRKPSAKRLYRKRGVGKISEPSSPKTSKVSKGIQVKAQKLINEFGETRPDDQIIKQAITMIDQTKDLSFALEKVVFHRNNEQRLKRKHEIQNELNYGSPEQRKQLEAELYTLTGILGGYTEAFEHTCLKEYAKAVKRLVGKNVGSELARRITDFIDNCLTMSPEACEAEMKAIRGQLIYLETNTRL